jgi:hypothetical protein
MAEVRTTSATGGQKGVKPERHDLLPRKGLSAIARVFAFGAEKYADHNWRNRYEWGKSLAALERHVGAVIDGETYDFCDAECSEKKTGGKRKLGTRTCKNHSGLPHLAHAGFHVLVLLTWLEEDGEGADNPMDDRWPAAMERARRLKAEEVAETDGTLGSGWEDVGWTSLEDLAPLRDHINETARRIALISQGIWPVPINVTWSEEQLEQAEQACLDPQEAIKQATSTRASDDAREVLRRTLTGGFRKSWVDDYDAEHLRLPFPVPTSFADLPVEDLRM